MANKCGLAGFMSSTLPITAIMRWQNADWTANVNH